MSATLQCPLCGKNLWKTENGLAAHVWHDHPESKICMGHGRPSLVYGDPARAMLPQRHGHLRSQNSPQSRCSMAINAFCAKIMSRYGESRKALLGHKGTESGLSALRTETEESRQLRA